MENTLSSMVLASPVPSTSALPVAQGDSLATPTFGLFSLLLGVLGDEDDDEIHQRWSSLIGIIVAICGNILISFALNIQRYAHVRIEREAEGERVRMRSRRRLSTSTYGSINDPYRDDPEYERNERAHSGQDDAQELPDDPFQFYNDQETGDPDNMEHSVLSDHTLRPNDKSSMNGDRPSYLHSPYWWAGIVLMTMGEMGNFLAYGFAPASIVSPLGVVALISNCIIAPFMLKEKFRQRDFWGVVVAVAGAVVVVMSAETSETKIGPHDIWVMITTWEFELYLGLTGALIIILMYSSEKYGGRTILIDIGLVGLFGGYTALSTKGVASLLSFTLWHVITFPVSYLLVAVLVFSALMQVRYINRALQRFDSTQVIPTQFVLFTLSVIIGSAVLYRDFESATLSRALKFVGGCALTFLGVYFITSGRTRNEDELSYGDEDEEAGVRFLNGERYRDSIDESSALNPRPDKSNDVDVSGPSQLRSSRNSIQSTTSDGHSLSTPKGLLSPSGSVQDEPLSEEDSLSQGLATPSPPLQSQSLTSNPWASPQPSSFETAPETPPSRQPQSAQTPPFLFRFPSAPTNDESTSSALAGLHSQSTNSLQPPADIATPAQRRRSTPRTPQSNSRNSVTLRLTPGPLIGTPLSSTLSAVVADSLLRGEGNSVKHQRSKSAKTRRLAAAPFIADAFSRQDSQAIDSSAVTVTPGSSRFNSTTDIRPVNTRHTTDAKVVNSQSDDNAASTTRIRSFSDSIGGHLAWLGGTLLGSKKSPKTAQSTEPTEDDPRTRGAES